MRDSVLSIQSEISDGLYTKEFTSPVWTTARLSLRQLQTDDAAQVLRLHSETSVNEFLERPCLTSIAQAKSYIDEIQASVHNGDTLVWAIIVTDISEMIGAIYLWNIYPIDKRAEIGMELLPEFQGNGIGFEALMCVLEHAFLHLGFHSIEADVDPANFKAIRLLEKCGFKMEGYFHEITFHHGRFQDRAVYTLLDPFATIEGGAHHG